MSQRDAVKMTEAEVADFLESLIKVQAATVNPDGSPHLSTLFYVMRDGKIAFWTYGKSQKIRNLERDPRISCLVEDGTDYFELRGVSISGTAELIRDHDELLDLGTAVAMRMVGADDPAALGEMGTAMVQKQALKRVGVLVTPDKVATWDHAKMLAAFGGGDDKADEKEATA
ncbi:pyridoxamine 5'-phosphate oxidase family protein [Nocardioides speluncae]|uniref:pyridoxamine 5'-phosphate oxidase family protein n=1 Tax=Nocardioides speluncae TaxID=2670337 RepID=UPI000D69CD22|nr:pyridoxamine 5'-phosphate oxidase family protein [Nocardioides speluncae]